MRVRAGDVCFSHAQHFHIGARLLFLFVIFSVFGQVAKLFLTVNLNNRVAAMMKTDCGLWSRVEFHSSVPTRARSLRVLARTQFSGTVVPW